jgi:predicted transposase YdaD
MFELHDIRETRVYQEIKELVMAEERQRQQEWQLGVISRMAADFPVEVIAKYLRLDVDFVREHMPRKPA